MHYLRRASYTTISVWKLPLYRVHIESGEMFVQVLVLSTFLSAVLVSAQHVDVNTLRLVNVLYRHGDRAPVYVYPTYIHNATEMWPAGMGWLTTIGIRQHYSLGSYLRRRYQGFISDSYDHTQITIHSSDIERCLMSAESNLAGMFPPSGTQVWNPNIAWQPIPVHTRPLKDDNMLSQAKDCPRFDEVQTESFIKQATQAQNDNLDFFEFLFNKTGFELKIYTVWIIADSLFCDQQHNITWPDWVNSTVHEKLQTFWELGFQILYSTTEAVRLKGGPLLKEWISLSQRKMDDSSDLTKMNIYSGHDTTVLAVLCALGNCHSQILPYTSTVIMEVHELHPGKFHVELFLRNMTSTDPNDDTQPIPLTLPGCDFRCPIERFLTLTKNVIPIDWDAECRVGTTPAAATTQAPAAEEQMDKFRTPFIIAVSVLSVIVVLLLGIIVFMSRKRSSSDLPAVAHVYRNQEAIRNSGVHDIKGISQGKI